jgi:hypothetical protein
MICPNCHEYPINQKSKHKLCIKCGYEVASKLAKEKRKVIAGKETPNDRECPCCKQMFTPRYKDHKFCGIECQKTLPNKIKNANWMQQKRKSMRSRDAVNLRIRRRKNNFNKFETKTEMI